MPVERAPDRGAISRPIRTAAVVAADTGVWVALASAVRRGGTAVLVGAGSPAEQVSFSAFDLFVDGADHGAYELAQPGTNTFDVSREPTVVAHTPPEPETLRFDGLGAGDKSIELWFPANAVVELTGFPRCLHRRASAGSLSVCACRNPLRESAPAPRTEICSSCTDASRGDIP